MRNAAFLLVIAILAALGGAAGWYWWTEWRFVESTDDAYVQADTGIISPKIDGYIRQVRVRDNQSVAAGDVMFVIDDRDFAAKTAQAEAGGRDCRSDRRDLCEPSRFPAGDNRPGRDERDQRRYRSRTGPPRPAPIRRSHLERLRQPATLRERRCGCPQGAGRARQGPRGSDRRAQPARGVAVAEGGGRSAAGAGPREPLLWRAAISTTR